MKSIFLLPAFLTLMFFSRASGQGGESEVIKISEVIVTEKNSKFFSEDQTTISIGNSNFTLSRQQNLGVLMNHESPALVRSYGSAGSLISLSLHGTGTNHAAVSWNGFPVNSPSTGQADLSLIPIGFMQEVDLVNGASGALFGSGTFGGYIELINEPDWNNRVAVNFSTDLASFHTRGNFLSLQAGGKKIQYTLSALDRKAENDFTYKDVYRYNSPEITAEHNNYESRGIIQNLYVNAGNGNFIEAGTWYQYKMKEIPSLMGSYNQSNALQVDGNFRTYLNYRKNYLRSTMLVKSAYFSDDLHYTDKINVSDEEYSVNSRIVTARMMGGIEYRHYISSVFTAGAGASLIHIHAVTNNYYSEIRENEYAMYGNLKIKLSDWIINAGIRQEFYHGIDPVLQYSFGIRFKAGEKLLIRSNISSKFRKPTLNEKYWKPGGNSGLNPEKGWGGDLSAEAVLISEPSNNVNLTATLSAYYQCIDNWIQWIVRDSLTPVEYKKVHARGMEAVVNYHFMAGQFKIYGNINYAYNQSIIRETYDGRKQLEGNQLIYVPRNVVRMNLNFAYKGLLIGCYGSVTGSRETLESADDYTRLPAFGIIDLVTGFEKQVNKFHAGLHFRIENLFNTRYEAIRSYPMPGRAYHVTLALDFSK